MSDLRTVGRLLTESEHRLKGAGIEQPSLEAGWLLREVLRLSPLVARLEPERDVTPSDWEAVGRLVTRRAEREPLQYLLGTQEFCGREFFVGPSVLIPRPESALLVEEAVRRCCDNPTATIVDVGTGSGCLAVSVAAALPGARVLAIDLSPEALAVARHNMAHHGVEAHIECLCGDLLGPLQERGPELQVDVILSNPPYIAETDWATLQPEVRQFEPRLALAGGPDRSEPISKSGEIGSGCLMTNIHLGRFLVSNRKNGRHDQSLLLNIMQIMRRFCLIIWKSQILCPFHCQPSRAGCSQPILSTSRLQRVSLSSPWTHLPPELFSSLFWRTLSMRRCVCVLSPRPNILPRAIRLNGKELQNLLRS